MKKTSIWLAMLVLLSTLLTSCGVLEVGLLKEAPATPSPAAEATEAPPVEAPPAGVEKARDTALVYLLGNAGIADQNLDEASWSMENLTPSDQVGASTLRFTAGGWVVTISYPIVAPEAEEYQVAVENREMDIAWQGVLDAAGQVVESNLEENQIPVVAWLGEVVSLPAGSAYDDFVRFLPAGLGEAGIRGATPELDAEIAALRDRPEPGKYAHFWGTLSCPAEDYNDCQLVVERLRYGASTTGPEPVDGWEGIITTSSFNMGLSHVFVLEGDYPAWYSLDSPDPEIKAQIERLRNSGNVVRLSGELLTGVPDVLGTRIQVTGLELVGGESPDPYHGWERYVNAEYGFSFRYPPTWEFQEAGPESGEASRILLSQGNTQIYIGYKKTTEPFLLGPRGMPAGEIEERGMVNILGAETPKNVVVYEGLDKLVFYQGEFEGLEFHVQLDEDPGSGLNYSLIQVQDYNQEVADKIVESFEMILGER